MNSPTLWANEQGCSSQANSANQRARGERTMLARLWSLCGVQTAGIGAVASIWRPNRVTVSLVFAVSRVRN